MKIRWCIIDGQSGHQCARDLLETLYREETGCEHLPAIGYGPYGKPYFPDSPYHFSISHTASHAFCVLHDRPVGIDAEELSRRVPLSLARRILSPSELSQFAAADHPKEALLTFWVLKEAAAKLKGTGLTGFPNNTDFSLDDPRVQRIDNCVVAVMTEEGEDHAL